MIEVYYFDKLTYLLLEIKISYNQIIGKVMNAFWNVYS